jgi:cysteinyl-tRNA synthetase
LTDFLVRLEAVVGDASHPDLEARLSRARAEFRAEMANDVNVPNALRVVFDLVREMNTAMDQQALGAADARRVRETFTYIDSALGVLSLRRQEDARPPVPVAEIDRLIEERRDARRTRQFARADQIRHELEARGILLEDSTAGTRWKRK